jgi:hypothetical protein
MQPSKDALGHEQIAVLTSAVGFTSIPAGTETVLLQAETQNVRWRDDGTNPTSTVGLILIANTLYEFTVGQLARMKFIEAAATAKLNIAYYGRKTA